MKTAADIPNLVPASLPTGNGDNVSRFIAACLAPLPAGEKPAESRTFLRQLQLDKMIAWNAAFEEVEYFEALHKVADLFADYAQWAPKNGRIVAISVQCFGRSLTSMGLETIHSNGSWLLDHMLAD